MRCAVALAAPEVVALLVAADLAVVDSRAAAGEAVWNSLSQPASAEAAVEVALAALVAAVLQTVDFPAVASEEADLKRSC